MVLYEEILDYKVKKSYIKKLREIKFGITIKKS